jgi:hypothetical protein
MQDKKIPFLGVSENLGLECLPRYLTRGAAKISLHIAIVNGVQSSMRRLRLRGQTLEAYAQCSCLQPCEAACCMDHSPQVAQRCPVIGVESRWRHQPWINSSPQRRTPTCTPDRLGFCVSFENEFLCQGGHRNLCKASSRLAILKADDLPFFNLSKCRCSCLLLQAGVEVSDPHKCGEMAYEASCRMTGFSSFQLPSPRIGCPWLALSPSFALALRSIRDFRLSASSRRDELIGVGENASSTTGAPPQASTVT